MNQINCKNLYVKYDNETILENINFTIEENDYLAVIGENGSGKTTLLKAILDLIPVSRGKVVFTPTTIKNKIGYLPQKSLIQKNFPASVMEVVLSGFVSKKKFVPFYTKDEKKKALENMNCLKISNLTDRSFQKLSGGQQQRVLLARALSSGENIIFMDEPVSNLDPIATNEFYEAVNHLNKKHNVTIVTTTHDIKTIVKYATKILYLDKKVLFFGTTEEYLKSNLSNVVMGSDNHGIN